MTWSGWPPTWSISVTDFTTYLWKMPKPASAASGLNSWGKHSSVLTSQCPSFLPYQASQPVAPLPPVKQPFW